jgi:hypothetical protein
MRPLDGASERADAQLSHYVDLDLNVTPTRLKRGVQYELLLFNDGSDIDKAYTLLASSALELSADTNGTTSYYDLPPNFRRYTTLGIASISGGKRELRLSVRTNELRDPDGA